MILHYSFTVHGSRVGRESGAQFASWLQVNLLWSESVDESVTSLGFRPLGLHSLVKCVWGWSEEGPICHKC